MRHGSFISNHPKGQRAEHAVYAEGRLEGLYRAWHPNGRAQTLGVFHQDEPVGLWLRWTPEGRTLEVLNLGGVPPTPAQFNQVTGLFDPPLESVDTEGL